MSSSVFPEALRLEVMDKQRFDPSQKQRTPSPPPAETDTIPSARAEEVYLSSYDSQRFDISKKERAASPGADEASSTPAVDTTHAGAVSEQSRKIVELCAALDPSDTHSFPSNQKLFTYEDDSSSENISGASSVLYSGSGDIGHFSQQTTAPTTPAASDNGHDSAKGDIDSESVVQDLPPSSLSVSDDNTEIRITDHIVRYGGTTTRTIVRPIPTSPCGSCVSLPGTAKRSGPFSRPTSPVPVLSSLNCFAADAFEVEVDRVCQEREKSLTSEGELKVFVREEINRAREARFKAPLEELTNDQLPVTQC